MTGTESVQPQNDEWRCPRGPGWQSRLLESPEVVFLATYPETPKAGRPSLREHRIEIFRQGLCAAPTVPSRPVCTLIHIFHTAGANTDTIIIDGEDDAPATNDKRPKPSS
jgi:hypothetical protein